MDATSSKRRALRHRLAWRFTVGLCLGAAVILVVAGIWNVRLQRNHMTDLVRTSADRIAETIRLSTRDAMQRNQVDEVHRIMETIGRQRGLERIRIFDGQGRITYSTDHEEVDRLVDKQAEQCYLCHAEDEPLEHLDKPERIRIFDEGDHRVLGIIAPIRNEETCWTAACHAHPADQKILGVLDVQMSLAPVDTQLAESEWQLGAGLVLTVLAVVCLTGVLIWYHVLRPVRALTDATVQVGAGDLSQRVDAKSRDEIGALERRWNEMVEELARTRAELQQWSHTLEDRVDEKTRELETAHKHMLVAEKMSSLGKLAAVVAHEINNPLAGIATYARVLQRELAGSDGDTERALDLIEKESRRCGDIVRNLLVFSRTAESRFEETDLSPVLDRCVMLLQHKAEMEGHEIRLDVAPDLPRIVCDAAQIQQAVLALAMNGLEAMEAGGILSIGVVPEDDGRGIAISVSDTGCGIPRADLDRVFEPFFTTKDEGEKGVGLGLAVVHGVVNHHQGRINVMSAPGEGTVFALHLPLAPPAPPEGGAT